MRLLFREEQMKEKRGKAMDKGILKPTDSKLPKETELMEQVLDNAQVAIVIADSDHKLEYVNPEFTRIFGYSAEEAIGKHTYDLIVPEDRRVELEELTERLEKLMSFVPMHRLFMLILIIRRLIRLKKVTYQLPGILPRYCMLLSLLLKRMIDMSGIRESLN